MTTRDELCLHGTDPNQADTDGDGLSDASEILLGSNPLDADENGDGTLRLSLPAVGVERTGTAVLSGGRLREGSLSFSVSAHRCDAGPTDPFCSVCGCYDPQDAILDAFPRTLTLKHDNHLSFPFPIRILPTFRTRTYGSRFASRGTPSGRP